MPHKNATENILVSDGPHLGTRTRTFPTGFVPFPGKAVDLGEDFPWYGSPDLMGEWIGNLEEAERKTGVGRQKSQRSAGGWLW